MKARWLYLMVAASSLTGCAHYTRAPLASADDVLSAPSLAALSADARKIDRPYLTPQAIDLTLPLTPNALAVIAVIENPDLKALRIKSGVTDAQAFAARLLPDPTFSANFDKILKGDDVHLGLGSQLGFDLSQLRTGRVVRESGAATKRQVRLDLAWAEWQTAGAARLQGVRITALEQQLVFATESAAAARDIFATVQRAFARGDLAKADVDARRQVMIDADSKATAANGALGTARTDLNKLLGLAPETMLRIAPAAELAQMPSRSLLTYHAISRRLDLEALRAGYDAAEADVHKAVLDQFPNLSFTVAAARDTANNYTLGPAIGFTLPFWNRNRGGIATANATRETLKAEYDARLHQTRAEIDAAITLLDGTRTERRELAAQIPALEDYAAATERAAQRGDVAVIAARAARQAVRDRRLALSQLEQLSAEQTIALELLSGGTSEGWNK